MFLQFTDGEGMTNHGVAITVWEEIDAIQSGYQSFIEEVQMHRSKRLAARQIAKAWRYHKEHIGATPKEETQHETGKVKRFFRTSKSAHKGKSYHSKTNLRYQLKRTSVLHSFDKGSLTPYPDAVIQSGKESYSFMMRAVERGERCMVQRCYVMLGGRQSEQFLQFRALKHLVQIESKVCCSMLCQAA